MKKKLGIAAVGMTLGLQVVAADAIATEHTAAYHTETSQQASDVAISEATVVQIGANGGVKLVVKTYALKNLSDTLHISYYDHEGNLQADDEYGYGTHDINQLLSIDAIKSFPAPIKDVMVSIKDESGAILLSMPAKMTSIGV